MITTIQIEESTREALKAQKRGGETYDEVITRMINQMRLDEQAAKVKAK